MKNKTCFLYEEAFVSFLVLVVHLLCCLPFWGYSETAEEDQTAEMVDDVIEEPPPPEGMVLIPGGEFEMGSHDAEARDSEKPVHTVYVDAFYMDTHEVTNEEFRRFVLANPKWQKDGIARSRWDGPSLAHWTLASRVDNGIPVFFPPLRGYQYLRDWRGNDYPIGEANHPVEYVSWHAAVAYAKWVGKRLPTEAEWEKAARGGLAGQKYPWGNTIDPGKANYGWSRRRLIKPYPYFSQEGKAWSRRRDLERNWWTWRKTRPVGSYAPNDYGLYDMCGNVEEWCLDKYDRHFYSSSPARNPVSGVNIIRWILDRYTDSTYPRVLRGGSWDSDARAVRCAARSADKPIYSDSGIKFGFGGQIYGFPGFGFRCARSVTP